MWKSLLIAVLCLHLCAALVQQHVQQNEEHGILQAASPETLLRTIIPQQLNATAFNRSRTSFPYYVDSTKKPGVYIGSEYHVWTSAFYAAELWAMQRYLNTTNGPRYWKDLAVAFTDGIAPEQFDTSTHDVGFMVFYSFGYGYLTSHNASYLPVLFNAAHSLSTRFNPKVGCIRSWQGYHFPVIVDNMMNLELLFWVAAHGGSKQYFDIAVSHADKTLKNHIRPAGNSWHLVDYDPNTGDILESCNCPQGLDQPTATWARGQAWAIYGFTMTYRYTNYTRYLDMAQKTSDWFIARLPADYVPLWDFEATDGIKDSSAASVAAAGLLELSLHLQHKNVTASKQYFATAQSIIGSLSSPKYLGNPSETQAILLHATGGLEQQVDDSLIYGDYYFVLALLRSLGIWDF